MACHVIDFGAAPWERGGHPLELKKTRPGIALTLLEFAPGFEDPNPCRRGHAGIVLQGELRFVLEDGSEITVPEGGGFLLESGTVHRARNAANVPVRLFVYSFEEAPSTSL